MKLFLKLRKGNWLWRRYKRIIKTRLKRRGDSLGFLIPEEAVKELGLIENQDVEFEIRHKTI